MIPDGISYCNVCKTLRFQLSPGCRCCENLQSSRRMDWTALLSSVQITGGFRMEFEELNDSYVLAAQSVRQRRIVTRI